MRRRGVFWIVLVVVLVLIAVAGGAPRDADDPLDPDSTAPRGTRGLVLLLEESGALVFTGRDVPEPGAGDVVLLLADDLGAEASDALDEWNEAGGTLVVAGSGQLEDVFAVADLIEGELAPGDCEVDALADLPPVDAAGSVLLDAGADEAACFGSDDRGYVVARAEGEGVQVDLGGPGPLTNAELDRSGNAALAVALLAPEPGTEVLVLEPSARAATGSGEQAPLDLVAPGVWRALLQLVVAVVVLAVWRAIRLGKPVLEPQPVQLEGSELVAAVGGLLQQTRSPAAAAEVVRHDLRRTLEARLGLPVDLPADAVAADLAARHGVDPDVVRRALGAPVGSDADLVEVTRLAATIRAEVLDGPHP